MHYLKLDQNSHQSTNPASRKPPISQQAHWIIAKKDKKDDVYEIMKEFAISSKELFLQCRHLLSFLS